LTLALALTSGIKKTAAGQGQKHPLRQGIGNTPEGGMTVSK
jgi:hypothetical protein